MMQSSANLCRSVVELFRKTLKLRLEAVVAILVPLQIGTYHALLVDGGDVGGTQGVLERVESHTI